MLNRVYRATMYVSDVFSSIAGVTAESEELGAAGSTLIFQAAAAATGLVGDLLQVSARAEVLRTINEQGFVCEAYDSRFLYELGYFERGLGSYSVASILYRHSFERGCEGARTDLLLTFEKCPDDFVVRVNTQLVFGDTAILQVLAKQDALKFAIVTGDLPRASLYSAIGDKKIAEDVLDKRIMIRYLALIQELFVSLPRLSAPLLKIILQHLIEDPEAVENRSLVNLLNQAKGDSRIEQCVAITKRPKSIWKVLNPEAENKKDKKDEKRADAPAIKFTPSGAVAFG